MTNWMDISGAPQDEAEFMVWFRYVDEWGKEFDRWEPRCRISEHGALQVYGRVDYDQDGWEDCVGEWEATHWAPQPEKPAEKADG